MISIKKVNQPEEMKEILEIRKRVFPSISPEKMDAASDLDLISEHFLAYDAKGSYCGSARWRFDESRVLLEKIAVLKEYREQGVGTSLVKEIINDIHANPNSRGLEISLYCPPDSIFLYQRFGFAKSGHPFIENGIIQIPMTKI